jgi:hypothetical protein
MLEQENKNHLRPSWDFIFVFPHYGYKLIEEDEEIHYVILITMFGE